MLFISKIIRRPIWPPGNFHTDAKLTEKFIKENPLITRAAGFDESTKHFFIKDADHPYVQEKPFDWIRGYQVGGKSLIWGRACPRWSKYEFLAPARDGYGIEWPIGYDDVAPWYSYVERFAGICGNKDGLEAMPDGDYLPPFEFNCVEKDLQTKNQFEIQGPLHDSWPMGPADRGQRDSYKTGANAVSGP